MDTAFVGICLSITLAVVLISLLSNSRAWAVILLVVGGCAILTGLLGWLFGGYYGSWDAPTAGAAIQQKALIIADLGLGGALAGIVGALKRSRLDE